MYALTALLSANLKCNLITDLFSEKFLYWTGKFKNAGNQNIEKMRKYIFTLSKSKVNLLELK